jgi:hypothetical protein
MGRLRNLKLQMEVANEVFLIPMIQIILLTLSNRFVANGTVILNFHGTLSLEEVRRSALLRMDFV